jgi:hypothetical protein
MSNSVFILWVLQITTFLTSNYLCSIQMGGLMETDEEADESWLQSRSSVLEASGARSKTRSRLADSHPHFSWLVLPLVTSANLSKHLFLYHWNCQIHSSNWFSFSIAIGMWHMLQFELIWLYYRSSTQTFIFVVIVPLHIVVMVLVFLLQLAYGIKLQLVLMF